jgi:hypothetical protein
MLSTIPIWRDHTREERYYTASLYHVLKRDASPFWQCLRNELKVPEGVHVKDVGYEVCMLRDLAKAGHIPRDLHPAMLTKQTFDLVLTLSNDEVVLIEAKAHQGFSRKQIDNMKRTSDLLLQSEKLGIRKVHLAGLHSSRYFPQHIRTEYPVMALITWRDLVPVYPDIAADLRRADDIFGD